MLNLAGEITISNHTNAFLFTILFTTTTYSSDLKHRAKMNDSLNDVEKETQPECAITNEYYSQGMQGNTTQRANVLYTYSVNTIQTRNRRVLLTKQNPSMAKHSC